MSTPRTWGDSISLKALDWLLRPTEPQPVVLIVPEWAIREVDETITFEEMMLAVAVGGGRYPDAIWVETGFGEGYCYWKREDAA